MPFDPLKYLRASGIPYAEKGTQISRNFVGIDCPFCGDDNMHGGFHLYKEYYNCWRCGWTPLQKVIATLEDITEREASRIIKDFTIRGIRTKKTESRSLKIKKGTLKLPLGCGPLKKNHKIYLRGRNFNPDKLEKQFKLMGTGPTGRYKFRIIAPIYYRGKMVSYQGRDYTDLQTLRYKACAEPDELLHHKLILYNIKKKYKKIILVEGITDVWRMGSRTVALFGTGYTKAQLILLSRLYRQVFILFDSEQEAQKRATNLMSELTALGVETENVVLSSGDPGDLTTKEARDLKRELLAA